MQGYAKETVRLRNRISLAGILSLLLPLLASAQPIPAPGDAPAAIHYAETHQVDLPSGDPRRLRLPLLRAGTVLELSVRAGTETDADSLEWVQMELLRDDQLPQTGDSGRPRRGVLQPVLRIAGTGKTPVRFRVPWDGNYLVVLRQSHPKGQPVALEVDVRLRRTPETPTEPFVLSSSTRRAVAIFSGGLLWTTLWLCGVPIIRAFRSRSRRAAPPWFG